MTLQDIDWASFWVGLSAGILLAVIIRDIGDYTRRNRK